MVEIGVTASPRWRAKSSAVSTEPRALSVADHVLGDRRLRRTRAGRPCAIAFSVAASAGSLTTSPSSGARPFEQIVLRRARAVAELVDRGRSSRRRRAARPGSHSRRSGWRAASARSRGRSVPCALRIASQASIAPGTVTACGEVGSIARMPLREQRLGRGLGAGAAGAVVAPHRLARLRRSGRSSRRRCRSCAARPRTAPRPRSPRHPPRCRRRAARRSRRASRADARSPPCLRRRSPASGRADGNRGS